MSAFPSKVGYLNTSGSELVWAVISAVAKWVSVCYLDILVKSVLGLHSHLAACIIDNSVGEMQKREGNYQF